VHTGALPATMQAIVQRRYGEAPEDVLGVARLPIPTAGPREVLVRVRAAGVDRGTWHLMAGRPYLARAIGFGLRRPKTPVPGLTVATVGALIAEGVITPAVDRTFRLDEAATAVRYLADGQVRGKLVIVS
jgi:NADPH:quinone reductase-like Zn-dependent oxidoreductase